MIRSSSASLSPTLEPGIMAERFCAFEHASQPPKPVVDPGAQGHRRDAEFVSNIAVGAVTQDCFDHRIPVVGTDTRQGISQLGAQDQQVDVVEAGHGYVLAGEAGPQRRPSNAALNRVDRGVCGDDQEPVHQRARASMRS